MPFGYSTNKYWYQIKLNEIDCFQKFHQVNKTKAGFGLQEKTFFVFFFEK